MENNINDPSKEGSNEPNKVPGEEHNKSKTRVFIQLDLEDLIKEMEEEEKNQEPWRQKFIKK